MKKLLYDCFGILKDDYPDFKVIGKEAIFSVDKDKYAKLSFTRFAAERANEYYSGYSLDIIHRSRGKIDNQTVAFRDIFEKNMDENNRHPAGKVIGENNGFSWVSLPTSEDLVALSDSVFDYLDFVKNREEAVRITEKIIEVPKQEEVWDAEDISCFKRAVKSYNLIEDQLQTFNNRIRKTTVKEAMDLLKGYDFKKNTDGSYCFDVEFDCLVATVSYRDNKFYLRDYDVFVFNEEQSEKLGVFNFSEIESIIEVYDMKYPRLDTMLSRIESNSSISENKKNKDFATSKSKDDTGKDIE